MKYKKIWIFGGTGSGKSTLAQKLSNKLKIPNYSTDQLVYKKGWGEKYSEKNRNKKLGEITKKHTWIIEGIHGADWINPGFKKANIIILLDFSRFKLLKRAGMRYFKRLIGKENKMGKDSLKATSKLLKEAWIYKNENLIKHKNLINQYKKKYIILKNQKEINEFLETLK